MPNTGPVVPSPNLFLAGLGEANFFLANYAKRNSKAVQQLVSLTLVIVVFLGSGYSYGQGGPPVKQTERGNQQWFTYALALKNQGKISALTEASYRTRRWLNEPAQYLFRANVYYQLSKAVRLGGGLAFSSFYTEAERRRQEWRPHQELSLSQRYGKLGLSHRFQLEERFVQTLNPAEGTSASRFNFRFRYRLQAQVPLLKPTTEAENSPLHLIIGNEVMLNAGRQIISTVFDQNRFTVGPAWQLSPAFTLQALYQNQYAATARPGYFRHEHLLLLTLRHELQL